MKKICTGLRTSEDLRACGDTENVSEEDVAANIDPTHLQKTGKTADQIEDRFVSTGDVKLDEKLKGGFRCGEVTELVGESATGKTLFGLQLCLSVQQKSSKLGAVYISTECAFPSKRLAELVKFYTENDPTFPKECVSNIAVEHTLDSEALMSFVWFRLSNLCRELNAGVIILDSVAAVYPSDNMNIEDQAEELMTLAKKLHQIARANNLAVVVVNQVSARRPSSSLMVATVEKDQNAPSLGLAWSSMITSRIFLANNPRTGRFMKVVFCPYLPVQCVPFEISKNGISAPPLPGHKLGQRYIPTKSFDESESCSAFMMERK